MALNGSNLIRQFKLPETKKYLMIKSNLLGALKDNLDHIIVFTISDSTDHHLIQKHKKKEQSNLIFMANVAHDLRSPLSVIKGYNDLIKINLAQKDQNRLQIYFKRFDDQLIYMSSIIEDIIDMAKFKSYKFML